MLFEIRSRKKIKGKSYYFGQIQTKNYLFYSFLYCRSRKKLVFFDKKAQITQKKIFGAIQLEKMVLWLLDGGSEAPKITETTANNNPDDLKVCVLVVLTIGGLYAAVFLAKLINKYLKGIFIRNRIAAQTA